MSKSFETNPEIISLNEMSFTHLGETALGTRVLPPVRAYEELYETMLETKRNMVLELPRNETGLDLHKVDDYRKQMGAPRKPVLFLDPDNYARAIGVYESLYRQSTESKATHSSGGRYLEELDIVIVNRDHDAEGLNGPGYTESIAVHEIAHSSAVIHPVQLLVKQTGRFRKRATVSPARTRTGFSVNTYGLDEKYRGMFLEEGYADYERGQFVDLQRQAIGITTRLKDFERPEASDKIPDHYWCMRRDVTTGTIKPQILSVRSAVPAATLELLITQDEQILGALRKGRSDVEGLREVAKRVNAIVPGVYKKMMNVDIDAPDGLMKSARIFVEVYKATSASA